MIDAIDQAFSDVLADPAVSAIGGAIAVAGVALWVAAAWWAYCDATRRTGSVFAPLVAAGWIVVSTPLLMPLSLAVYALARPQQTAAQKRARRMAASLLDELGSPAEAQACPGCAAEVEPTWLRCPACTIWLAAPCVSCGGWSNRDLEACPWCGSEERAAPAVELQASSALAASRSGRSRRPFRAVGPGRGRVHRPSTRRVAADSRPTTPVPRR
jgi:hypothetical protein